MSFHNEPSSVLGSSSLAYTTSNNEAVLSKNGAYLLQVVSDGLKIHNLENGSEVSVALSGVRPGGNLAPVAISNDGSIVFVRTWNGLLVDSGSGGLFKVSLDGSHQRLDVDQSGNTFSYQGWSIEGSDVDITPDGSKIVFAIRDTLDHKTWTAQQTNVYVKDLSTGSLIQVDLPSTNGVSVSSSNPRISSDGQRVLFETNLNLDGQFFGTNSSPSISPQTSVYAVSVTSGGVYEKVNKDGANQISSAYGWHAEMSADGSAVVFQTSEQLSADDINSVSDVYFKNLTNGQIRLVSDGSSKGGIYPWISPDGAFVAYKPYSYQVENQGLIWSVVSSKTQVIPGTTELSIGSFPNDSIYALSDNRVLLWSWNQYLADEVDPNANYYLYNYKIPSATVVNDTSKSVATYSLSNNSYSVNEGSTASFTLTTKNLASGTSVPYTLSGVSSADVSGGLSGTAVVNSSGVATISATLLNDNLTEGAETLTVTAVGASASTVVNDTSKQSLSSTTRNFEVTTREARALVDNLGVDDPVDMFAGVTNWATLPAGGRSLPVIGETLSGDVGLFSIPALDPEGEKLTFTITQRGEGDSSLFTMLPGTNQFRFRELPDFNNPKDGAFVDERDPSVIISTAGDNLYTVEVQASGYGTTYAVIVESASSSGSTGSVGNDTSNTPAAGNTLDVIVDLFGTVSMLKGLSEINNGTVHTLTYNGHVFNYAEVDSLLTTVVRNGEFTAEFAQEIADSYPTAAGITYNTVVSLVGAADLDNLLIAVAGADGSYAS